MKQLTLVCIALLAAAAMALLPGSADDMVELSCASAACPASGENGVLLVAKTVKQVIEPTPQSSISVGTVNSAYKQVVAFRLDRSPAIKTDVTWTSQPETVTLNYPELVDVPLQIWVICASATCGAVTQTMRNALETFRLNANDLLARERSGMRIIPAAGPGVDWISDETQNAALMAFRDFENDQCPTLNTAGRKNPNAMNMYLVRTVDNEPSSGYRCPVENLAVDGWKTFWTTKLHEVGHMMSLKDARIGSNPEENMMYSMPRRPSTRQYFTEGQVFRMHFNVDSSLNTVFRPRDPSLQRDCGNTNADAEKAVPPCPPLSTVIWDEN